MTMLRSAGFWFGG